MEFLRAIKNVLLAFQCHGYTTHHTSTVVQTRVNPDGEADTLAASHSLTHFCSVDLGDLQWPVISVRWNVVDLDHVIYSVASDLELGRE